MPDSCHFTFDGSACWESACCRRNESQNPSHTFLVPLRTCFFLSSCPSIVPSSSCSSTGGTSPSGNTTSARFDRSVSLFSSTSSPFRSFPVAHRRPEARLPSTPRPRRPPASDPEACFVGAFEARVLVGKSSTFSHSKKGSPFPFERPDMERERGSLPGLGNPTMAFRLGSDHEGTKPTMTMAVRVPTRLSRPSMRARAEASEGKSLSIRAKRFVRPLTAAALAVVLSLHPVDAAIAARSSGRMGGNAFHASSIQRSPSSSGKESMRRSRVSPSTTFGWGFFPLVPVTPFGFGYGYGYGYGGGGGGGLFTLLVLGMIAYVAYEAMQGGMIDNGLDDRITVARVQIGLLGLARELQADLDRIAARADTSTAVGLKFVLEETVLALMRNPEYMVYGGSATMVVRGPEEAEDYFNTFSMQERGKFTRETLVNVGGRKKGESGVLQGASISNEYIVVTILVAADGKFKLPRCTNLEETKEALTKVGSLRTGSLQAVEVLWQPQEAGDTLTREELVRDYPAMNTL